MAIRVLLIKRAAMGDILMATPLIRQLKQKSTNVELDFLVSHEFAGVLKSNPYIDKLIMIPGALFGLKKIFSLIKYVMSLRGKYDYVLILDKHYYFNFIGRLIAKKTVGYVRESVSRLFLYKYVSYDDVMRYHGLYYLDLLQASKIAVPDYTDYALDFTPGPDDEKYTEQIMHDYQLDSFVIIVNSGGNNQFEAGGIRMLPESKVVQLINRLGRDNRKVVLLGGAIDEINYNSYLGLTTNTNILNMAGKLTLGQSAVLMRYAATIYTTDCGAMHIAISQGLFAKLYCFFGPTCPYHVLPLGKNIRYYWSDQDLFSKYYPLYGKLPDKNGYFAKLNIDEIFLEDEAKKLY